jgi:hypothetical protein
MEAFICIKKHYFKWMSIDSIPLIDVYDLSSKHFVSWHGHMDLATCKNIDKEIVWGEMIGCITTTHYRFLTSQKNNYYLFLVHF